MKLSLAYFQTEAQSARNNKIVVIKFHKQITIFMNN